MKAAAVVAAPTDFGSGLGVATKALAAEMTVAAPKVTLVAAS